MALTDRFLGRPDGSPGLVARPTGEKPSALIVLFVGSPALDADAWTLGLRRVHPALTDVTVELATLPPEPNEPPTTIGLIGWGEHVIKWVGLDGPCGGQVFEACVRPAQFDASLKEDARLHEGHGLLVYAGRETDPVEQLTALMAVGASLAFFDALLLLNEPARAAFPVEALLADDEGVDRLEAFRQLPIPLFYGGFVKLEADGFPGVWMRTFGAHRLNLPDLALLAPDHDAGNATFDLFANVLAYLRDTRGELVEGNTLQISDTETLRVRSPAESEAHLLVNEGKLWVLESTT